MKEENRPTELQRYLDGEMSPEERAAFEARLAADPELQAEVDLHQELDTVLADEAVLDFSALVAEVVGAEGAPQAPPRTRRPVWAIAAAILLLAVVGFFVLRPGPGADPDQLFAEYFSPYEAPATFRSDDSTLNAQYQSAFDAYNAGDFEVALPAFDALRGGESTMPDFYYALSALSANKSDLALPVLRELAGDTPHVYRSQSRWYLALTLLERGETDEATERLEAIVEDGGKFAEPAQALLDEL